MIISLSRRFRQIWTLSSIIVFVITYTTNLHFNSRWWTRH